MIIRLKNLRAETIIGAHEDERRHPQGIVVNVELECDVARAAETDDLREAVDYEALRDAIVRELGAAECFLLEALAERLLRIVLACEKVTRATVEVDKPGALRGVDSVSVTASGAKEAS